MRVARTMSWEELARAFLESLIQEQGGLVTAVIILSFVSIGALIVVIGLCVYFLKKKQGEIDRIAEEKKKLEQQVIKRRLSSSSKQKKAK